MTTTAAKVITHLESLPLNMKQEAADRYRLNSPLRPDSDSHPFVLTISTDGESGVYFDHVTDETGSLYDLAQALNIIPTPHLNGNGKYPAAASKRSYADLADYAEAHGVTADIFRAAGWQDKRAYQGRPALAFKTKTGIRYRFTDGKKPPYISPKGYRRCWYGLDRAVKLATESGQPLIICNGEASTVVGQHYGLAATAITGGEKGTMPAGLLTELQTAYSGPLLIVFDCDKRGRKAGPELAEQLAKAGFKARAVDLGGNAGFDLADYCHLQTSEAAAKIGQCPTLTTPEASAPQAGNYHDKPTHDELATRWLSANSNTVYGLGDWRRYQAGLWPVLPPLEASAEIYRTIKAAKPEGIRPTASLLTSVTELAKREVLTTDSVWDADPDYLVCGNGTLHIPTRTLTDHDPALYATSGVGFHYDPNATAPHWSYFLDSILSEPTREFLQEFAGYALTTDTSHETAVWLYGPPGGGKSTFLSGLQTMLESRAGLLSLADIERSRFALANLPGKTLVVATEQPETYIASTDVLDAIISGELVTFERKFKDPVTIAPRCKIAWAMNDLPRINNPNNGIFRRVKVVEFPAIPTDDQMPELKEELKKEGAGILNWALEGLDRLRRRGRFAIPAEVIGATENFKQTNDIPAAFVTDCCLTGYDSDGNPFTVQSAHLYNRYRQWCIDNGHKPQSSTSLAQDWKRLKFERYRAAGRTFWRGIGLMNDSLMQV